MLKFAKDLAKKAGDKALKHIDDKKIVKYKGDSPVTDMDIKIGKLIISAIQRKYPKHNIISEETENIDKGSDYTWIIDPIDGTRNFEKGIRFFGTCIALYCKDNPVFGVIYNPCNKELYYASTGKGAFCNNKRLKVSNTTKLSDSIIALTAGALSSVKNKEILLQRLNNIVKNTSRIRLFSGPFFLCFLAQGLFDAYFDLSGNEKIWDKAAGFIIAKEAGAKITGLEWQALWYRYSPCSSKQWEDT